MKNKKILRYCSVFLVLIWMIVVFAFSAQNAEKSLNISGKVISKMDKVISIEEKDKVEIENRDVDNVYNYSNITQKIVRKNAHYFLYLVGGMFLSMFFFVFFGEKIRNLFLSCMVGVLYAISDEIHQLFVPGRTGCILDVGIDTLGIITGIIIFMIFIKILKKNSFCFKK